MISHGAVPFLLLAVLFLPLPFILLPVLFVVLLAVRPRGEPDPASAAISRFAGPTLLRSPPR